VRRIHRSLLALASGAATLGAVCTEAHATGFTDVGQDITPREKTTVVLTGSFRTRGEALVNLDLDRGPTPSGQLLFPVPVDNVKGQTLLHADTRFRTDVAVYAPFGGIAVKSRIDVLDNLQWGSEAQGVPSTTSTQLPANGSNNGRAFRVKRAWAEASTPFGLLAVGRMGNQWGLGMLANGGDCSDCDSGDAVDRVAFAAPAIGHIFAAAFDLSSTVQGPLRKDGQRSIGLAPSANTPTLTLAAMKWHSPKTITRRKKANKITIDYGGYFSQRWQNRDVPAAYLPGAAATPIGPTQVTGRDFSATAVDGWLRIIGKHFRVEGEIASLYARIGQASLLPGLELRDPITSKQLGLAVESEYGDPDDIAGIGLDFGYASGDRAPGFGAYPGTTQKAPQPGDLDGAQANPPYDTTANNFRFHSDYRIDRILFREIIGTVTDAVYVRPHFRFDVFKNAQGRLETQVFGVYSAANYASSTPGGKSPLGVELDPSLVYHSRDGLLLAFDYAVLFPLSGLDNPTLALPAKPAQLARVRAVFAF